MRAMRNHYIVAAEQNGLEGGGKSRQWGYLLWEVKLRALSNRLDMEYEGEEESNDAQISHIGNLMDNGDIY